MGDFQPNQIPWLKREQVAGLTEQQFRDMDQAGLLPSLTKSQLRGIPKAKIGYVNIAGLGEKQIPWLTEGQIRNTTGQQFRDLFQVLQADHFYRRVHVSIGQADERAGDAPACPENRVGVRAARVGHRLVL